MAPRHEAPRLPGLVQTRGGAQEKPIELPAVAAAAVAAGAAAAPADDAQAPGGGGRAAGAGATRADDVRRTGLLGSMASVALSEAEKVYIVHGVQVATPRRQAPGAPGPARLGAPSVRSGGGGLGLPCG